MTDETPIPSSETAATIFYSGALSRIRRIMLVLAPAALAGVWTAIGWRFALGFAVGCLLAWINFHWLEKAVMALADRVTRTGQRGSSSGIVARFLLRYFLIALAAYVIFRVSMPSVYGLLVGLFLPVAAIFCEAVYEAYVTLRRGL